jgi:hypothetical protein
VDRGDRGRLLRADYLALDADGRFQRDALLAGSGELVVQRRNGGAEVLRRALELPPGERVTIELP